MVKLVGPGAHMVGVGAKVTTKQRLLLVSFMLQRKDLDYKMNSLLDNFVQFCGV